MFRLLPSNQWETQEAKVRWILRQILNEILMKYISDDEFFQKVQRVVLRFEIELTLLCVKHTHTHIVHESADVNTLNFQRERKEMIQTSFEYQWRDKGDSSASCRCGIHETPVQSDGVSGEWGAAGLRSGGRYRARDHVDEGRREALQHWPGVPHAGRAALGDVTQVQDTQSVMNHSWSDLLIYFSSSQLQGALCDFQSVILRWTKRFLKKKKDNFPP